MVGSPTYQSRYSNSWALVIGINDYKVASPLAYARNDAVAVADVLEGRFGFPKKNITLLLDKDATVSAIRKEFFKYTNAAVIQPDDRLLVFFAGHGLTATGKRGEVGFLVPVDGKTDDLESLMRWDELTRNSDLVPAKHIFFLMDACYGGLALTRGPAFGSMRFLGDMLQRYARQVLTAGKADEVVADGSGVRPGHSIFTAHLLNAFEGGASTTGGVITANGVMAYVYDRVARDQYSHQTPHYGFLDGDGDFIFDTTILDSLRRSPKEMPPEGEGGAKGEPGAEDILINTSPEISAVDMSGVPVAEMMKELLSDPSKRIRLDDFVMRSVKRFLDSTDLRHFPVESTQPAPTQAQFIERINLYEEASGDIEQIVLLLSKWGDEKQIALLERIFKRIAEADKGSAGFTLWLHLSWYPIVLLMYVAGIAALANRNYAALRIALTTQVHVDTGRHTGGLPLIVPAMRQMTDLHDQFKWLPGHERNYVPRSEYLFKALQPILEDALFLGRSYEPLFDEFEVLLALIYADVTEQRWGPPGRFAWKHSSRDGESPFTRVVDEATKEKANWGPIQNGLFQGSFERFSEDVAAYKVLLGKLSWW